MNTTLGQLKKDRLKKLQAILKAGIEVYPSQTKRSSTNLEALNNFSKFIKKNVTLVGRLGSFRGHGGLFFVDLIDESAKIQLVFKKNILGAENFNFFRDNIERGDFLQVEGKLFLTKMGEKTMEVEEWKILSKTIFPLPEKWAGLKNEETRSRKRYLDLLTNPETKEKFKKRSLFIQSLRDFLLKNNFLEVETPILQDMAGGAIAKPFKTKHETLNQDFYLRIAPELYLKRLIVGGLEKVFEFARNFRNEGISPQHNPDFTMLEFYWAYADYEGLMHFTEKMLREIVPKINGSLKVKFQEKIFDFTPPYQIVTFDSLIKKELGLDIEKLTRKELLSFVKKNKIQIDQKISTLSEAKILDEIYKKIIRPKLKGPLFLTDYPKEMIPLAKTKEDNPKKIATFQLIINGWEIIKAYNELNDPIEQRKRFEKQARDKKKGDREAHSLDLDYIEALSYGMPPTAGWGMGIDRFLVILLNQKNVRDVILFPLRRKKDK